MFSATLLILVLSQFQVAPPTAPYLAEPPNGVGAIMPGPATLPTMPNQNVFPIPTSPFDLGTIPTPTNGCYPQFDRGYYGLGMPGGCVVPQYQSPQGGWTYLGSYNVPNYYHVYRPWKWVPTYSVQWHVETAGPSVTTGGGEGPVQSYGHPGPYVAPSQPYYGPSYPTPSWWGPQAAPAQPPQQPQPPQQQMMQQQQQTSNNVIVVPSTSSRKELPTLESLRRRHRQEVERCFARF